MKRGVAAALAAVLLVGTAAAVTLSLWEDYFGSLDQGQLEVVERLSETLPAAVTSNGATMTPLAAFGGHGALYLMLEVEAPAGTVLPELDEETEAYWLSGGAEPEVRMRLETAEGKEVEDLSYSADVTCLEDQDPTDNRITLVVNLSANEDLTGLTLRIPGLWKWGADNTFTPVFTGTFAFPISEGLGEDCAVTLDVAGITTRTIWGTFTLETLELSPLGVRCTYQAEAAGQEVEKTEDALLVQTEDGSSTAAEVEFIPAPLLTLVMQDGTEVLASGGFLGQEDGLWFCSDAFDIPVDLTQADYLLWGETKIPLH